MKKILEIGDYWLWQGKDSHGFFFNMTKKGVLLSGTDSGYYNLETLLKLKGLDKW